MAGRFKKLKGQNELFETDIRFISIFFFLVEVVYDFTQ